MTNRISRRRFMKTTGVSLAAAHFALNLPSLALAAQARIERAHCQLAASALGSHVGCGGRRADGPARLSAVRRNG